MRLSRVASVPWAVRGASGSVEVFRLSEPVGKVSLVGAVRVDRVEAGTPAGFLAGNSGHVAEAVRGRIPGVGRLRLTGNVPAGLAPAERYFLGAPPTAPASRMRRGLPPGPPSAPPATGWIAWTEHAPSERLRALPALLRDRFVSPEAAARAWADRAGVRVANATASAERLRGRGVIVPDGDLWRVTSLPPLRGSLPAEE